MTVATAAVVGPEPDLIARREGSAGVIRLNRPKAINAMTLEMSLAIDAALDQFEADPAVALVLLEGAGERGLCAGGDIRGLYESSRAGGDLGKVFWRQEYIMNARIAKFPEAVCRLHGRAGDGRRRRSFGARPPSRRHRKDQGWRCRRWGWVFFPMWEAPGYCLARPANSAPISG